MSAVTMTWVMKSILLYVETCCVDHGGLLEAQRMNKDDMDALTQAADAGLLTWGRIPAKVMMDTAWSGSRRPTHWARLTATGWDLAHQLRFERAEQLGPFATAVFAELKERANG